MQNIPLDALLADAAGRAAAYLGGLDSRPVAASPEAIERLTAALATDLPDAPTEPSEVLAFLDDLASPATVASAGGRYFGFVTGGALPATLAAQYLAAAWDQNSFSFTSSPALACLEAAALTWVKQSLGLHAGAEGALVTGATLANFTCLAAARNRVLAQQGWDADRDGLFGAPPVTVVVGEEAHSTLFKVLSMLGLGRERVVRVPADDQGRLRADALPQVAGPVILCLQAGNVNSGAFDPAEAAIAWARETGAWVHVDGAFGLWALAAPELEHLAAGFRAADSWATDAHKWLNVPYDCGLALVRDPEALGRAMSLTAAYLPATSRREAFGFTPDSSRRARAVEVWAALKSLGRSGLAAEPPKGGRRSPLRCSERLSDARALASLAPRQPALRSATGLTRKRDRSDRSGCGKHRSRNGRSRHPGPVHPPSGTSAGQHPDNAQPMPCEPTRPIRSEQAPVE
jgi:glutamate/tyrosine decarboxylase-like PLP-dependent enzyme